MKTKNLKISEETHLALKVFCAKNELRLNDWADTIIMSAITIGPEKFMKALKIKKTE